MQPVPRASVTRLEKYLERLADSKPKPTAEVELNELANLMNKVGFSGPHNKPGSARAFTHELLKSKSHLVNGQFTVHIVHGSKLDKIRYRDFKEYVNPYIEEVLAELEHLNLVQEEDTNVQL
jgi:hypothetical protein